MASALVSEAQAHTDRGPLSLSLDTRPSSSPFPSPSSSFLPPPMPGAHEFALKPPKRVSASSVNGTTGSVVNSKRDTASEPPSTSATPVESSKSIPPPTVTVPTDPVSVVDSDVQMTSVSSPAVHNGETKTESSPHETTSSLHQLSASSYSSAPSSSFTTPTTSTTNLPLTPQAHHSLEDSLISSNPVVFTSPASASNSPTHNKKMSINVAGVTNNNNNWDNDNNGSNFNDPLPSPSISSNRPAPPSPAMSRRTSSIRSSRSRGSRPPSQAISRTNSVRKSSGSVGGGINPSLTSSPLLNATPERLSVHGTLFSSPTPVSLPPLQSETDDFPSPSTPVPPETPVTAQLPMDVDKSLSTPPTLVDSTPVQPVVYIKIRDYGFAIDNDKHHGLGPDVPRSNHVGRLNKYLRRGQRRTSTASSASSTISTSEEEAEEEDEEDGWGGFNFGQGRLNWSMGAAGAFGAGTTAGTLTPSKDGFPTQTDLERNFGLSGAADELDDEVYADAEEDGEGAGGYDDEEPLYPGLYRALYSFVPEGTAEMALEEDQIIKVVGRGGGVGWAVVVKNWIPDETNPESGLGKVLGEESQHALVPESYLEAVKLDCTDDEMEDSSAV